MRFAREALPFVLPVVLLAIALVGFGRPKTGVVVAVLALAILLFFRIPTRPSHPDPTAVLAPANGIVTLVDEVVEPSLGDEPVQRVVTFLSVFDVHVQRSPVSGRVIESLYTKGRKIAAFRADAGDVNENQWTVIESDDGERFGVRQIAGMLARRVVSFAEVGDSFERGELIGLIKFGSRVDLLVPQAYTVEVERGMRLHEGATLVATPRSTAP